MRWTDIRPRASGRLARCPSPVICAVLASLSAFVLPLEVSAQTPSLPPRPSVTAQPQFLIVLDAAHGGTDTGAHLAEHLDEKDLALALTIRLRSMLSARGVSVVTTRESDATL